MGFIFKLSDISPAGLPLDQVIEPGEIELSSDEGTIIGPVRCVGSLTKPDDATVYFEGRIDGRIARECVRCLAIFEDDLSLQWLVLFKKASAWAMPGSGGRKDSRYQQDDDPDAGDDSYTIEGGQIDLLPVIREQIILSTPLQAICRDDCIGLCQNCGANLNSGKCSCATPNPVVPSEGVFHPDLSMANKHYSGRNPGNRRRGSMRKL